MINCTQFSHFTIITLINIDINFVVTKRMNIYLFYHFLVLFLDFLAGDVESFSFTQYILGHSTSKYLF